MANSEGGVILATSEYGKSRVSAGIRAPVTCATSRGTNHYTTPTEHLAALQYVAHWQLSASKVAENAAAALLHGPREKKSSSSKKAKSDEKQGASSCSVEAMQR